MLGDLAFEQVAPRRAVLLDGAGRRDVVGGDAVAEQRQYPRAPDRRDGQRFARQILEVGRVLHVGGGRIPLEAVGFRHLDRRPTLVAGEDVGVTLAEHLRVHRLGDAAVDLLRRGPDVAQEHRLAVGAGAERLVVEIDVGTSGNRIGHHQRWRGEEVHADLGMHPAFEVAVSREHRAGDEVAIGDGLADGRRQRATVADAGSAAIADQVEAERFEIVHEAGLAQVVRDHLGTRRETGLDPGFRRQAARRRVARQQAGAEHHRRVGGVGARRDRGDDDRAVAQLVLRAVEGHADAARLGRFRAVLLAHGCHRGLDGLACAAQRNAILRALRPGDARFDRCHVEVQHVAVIGLARAVFAEHALGAGVGFDERDLFGVAPGELQVAETLGVDREDAAGGAVLGRHVGDGGAVGERQVGEAIAEELDELADHAFPAQHLHDGQHEIGGGGALRQLPAQPETDHLRDEHGDRLAEHRRLGFDATDTPAEDAERVDHGGVRIRADQRVGVGKRLAVGVAREHHPRKVLEVHLVDDAGVGWHDAEVVEGLLPPTQKLVAFAVALELDARVERQRILAREIVDLHRVVDDQFHRRERVDALRITPQLHEGVAHRGKIHHRRHAGEVLQEHARGREGDLGVGVGRGVPAGERFDVGARDVDAVFVTQQVLQQDLERERQPGGVEVLIERADVPVGQAALADFQLLARLEGVMHGSVASVAGRGRCQRWMVRPSTASAASCMASASVG